jgi:hypothetical protein
MGGIDPQDKSKWPDYFAWIKNNLEKFHAVFSDRVKALDVSDYRASENSDGEANFDEA